MEAQKKVTGIKIGGHSFSREMAENSPTIKKILEWAEGEPVKVHSVDLSGTTIEILW